MLYKYKKAFSFRGEIGTCPNTEAEIDVTDRSLFFIRPYHVKEEDKALIDKEMKHLCYLGILKEGFSAYSSPVMLISRKLTQDKRVVTDFRHLNVRIAKNNLAYLFLKDTFSILGSSKHEVLLVLDLKDTFHSLRLSEHLKKVLQNTSLLWQYILSVPKNAHGIEYIPLNMAILYKCNFRLLTE